MHCSTTFDVRYLNEILIGVVFPFTFANTRSPRAATIKRKSDAAVLNEEFWMDDIVDHHTTFEMKEGMTRSEHPGIKCKAI